MQTILLKSVFEKIQAETDKTIFGEKVGIFGKLFGCWHENLSRPFMQNAMAYRTCLQCGARKAFNTETLQTHGAFYYPPIVREII